MQQGLTMWPSGRQPDIERTQLLVGQLSWPATATTLGCLAAWLVSHLWRMLSPYLKADKTLRHISIKSELR